jgi:hypothetical protein
MDAWASRRVTFLGLLQDEPTDEPNKQQSRSFVVSGCQDERVFESRYFTRNETNKEGAVDCGCEVMFSMVCVEEVRRGAPSMGGTFF